MQKLRWFVAIIIATFAVNIAAKEHHSIAVETVSGMILSGLFLLGAIAHLTYMRRRLKSFKPLNTLYDKITGIPDQALLIDIKTAILGFRHHFQEPDCQYMTLIYGYGESSDAQYTGIKSQEWIDDKLRLFTQHMYAIHDSLSGIVLAQRFGVNVLFTVYSPLGNYQAITRAGENGKPEFDTLAFKPVTLPELGEAFPIATDLHA